MLYDRTDYALSGLIGKTFYALIIDLSTGR